MKHKKVMKRKTDTERSKIMGKYAQLKRFHYDLRLQVYMYAFMYVDNETIPRKTIFLLKKRFLGSTRKFQPQEQSQKFGLDLVIYVQKIMSQIRTLMIKN